MDASALLFGALIAATDPVSVVALFRRLGVSERLTTLVDAESLFNDGAAAVRVRRRRSPSSSTGSGHTSAGGPSARFVWMTAGGIGVGLAVGYRRLACAPLRSTTT